MKEKKILELKIPEKLKVIVCNKKNQVTVIGINATKSMVFPFKIFLTQNKIKKLYITNFATNTFGKKQIKILNKLKACAVANLKQMFLELTHEKFYQKIKLVGVGYKVFIFKENPTQLMFKLGYSHSIYYQLPTKFNSHCIKFTKLFLFGKISDQLLKNQIMEIRKLKTPEPYKGKGILKYQEQIKLKIGKRA